MARHLALGATAALCALCAFGTPSISQVNVWQQWPWSADIIVDYHLSNNEGTPVDVSVAMTNGTEGLTVPLSAVTGPHVGLTASGDYRLVIDTAKLQAGGMTACGGLAVTLSLSAARADRDFALYRIYNLSTRTSTDVTVESLLNGEWGSVETDYAFAGGEYLPADVLIWTGVTNNPAYKTNCLVMRYVPPGSFTMLAQKKSPGTEVTLTSGFYVGVFEATQGQCELLNPSRAKAYYTNSAYKAMRPMGNANLSLVRGNNSRFFPEEYAPGVESYVGKARTITGNASFDLPTDAQWEYAARAGCTTKWYNGATGSDAEIVSRLARHANNGGLLEGATAADWDCSPENGTAIVGSYHPNAWGLYDCIGNVSEVCLDRFSSATEVVSNGPYTDFTGGTTNDWRYHVSRGGCYSMQAGNLSTDCRAKMNYEATYDGESTSSFSGKDVSGFRLICGATASRPTVEAAATLASATATMDGDVVLRPDASPFWRTAKGGEPVTVSIEWPDGAATATCTFTAARQAPISQTVERSGNAPYTTLSFTLPSPTQPSEERVWAAELSFSDANDQPLASATRCAQVATVLGQDGEAVSVRAPGSAAWPQYAGSYAVLPIAAGTTSLTIDGVTVNPGLDGAVGWYGAVLASGEHAVSTDVEGEQTIFCKRLGITVIVR